MRARRCSGTSSGREAWARLHEDRRADRLLVEEKCTTLKAMLEPAQHTRREWEAITADTRRVALAADLELRAARSVEAEESLKSADSDGPAPGDLAADDREDTIRAALGITTADAETTVKVAELTERSRETQARIDQMRSIQQPEPDNAEMEMSEPWSPSCTGSGRWSCNRLSCSFRPVKRSKPTTISAGRSTT